MQCSIVEVVYIVSLDGGMYVVPARLTVAHVRLARTCLYLLPHTIRQLGHLEFEIITILLYCALNLCQHDIALKKLGIPLPCLPSCSSIGSQ